MERELIIVGAGISGLGFAHFAVQKGQRPLLVEAAGRAGGAIHSHPFSEVEGGCWTELGAHTCYNSYGTFLDILASLGTLEKISARRNLPFRLLIDGRVRTIVGVLWVPGLLASLPRALWLRTKGATAKEYFRGIVGRRNFERVVGPALDAMTCQPAAEFPADALFQKKSRRKEVLRSYTGRMGIGSLIEPMARQSGLELLSGVAAERIEKISSGYRLSLADGRTITTETVVLAVAPDVAGRLLQDVSPELMRQCGAVAMAEIDSLAVVIPIEATSLPPLAGVIAHDDLFYSALSRDTVADPRHRSFTFHFRPGVDPQRQLARACEVLGVGPAAILGQAARRNRLPALRVGHRERVAAIDRQLAGGRLGLLGNWFSGISIEDCLLRARAEFRRLNPV